MKIVMSHNVLCISGDLKSVTVNDCTEVIQFVLMSCHSSFPYRTLCKLTVTHYCIYTVVFLVHFSGKCHTYANRKSMSQRTGVHLNSRKFVVRMSDILCSKFAEFLVYFFDIKEAFLCKYCIVSFYGMTFTHNKKVSVRIIHILRGNIHLVKIQCNQSLHNTHITTDMSAFTGNDHIYCVFSEIICKFA